MCLSLASSADLILARLAVRTTSSKKNSEPKAMSNARRNINRMVAPGLSTFRLSGGPIGHYSRVLRRRQKRLL
jgi:hypothetical protein